MSNTKFTQITIGHSDSQNGCGSEYAIQRNFTLKDKELNKPLHKIRESIEKRYLNDPTICLKCNLPLLRLIQIK